MYTHNGMGLPEGLQTSLDRYATHGWRTGDFLRACLANDLMMAAARADMVNIHFLGVIAHYIDFEMPAGCRGSYEAVDAWLEKFKTKTNAGG
jgi:hypothetical protein